MSKGICFGPDNQAWNNKLLYFLHLVNKINTGLMCLYGYEPLYNDEASRKQALERRLRFVKDLEDGKVCISLETEILDFQMRELLEKHYQEAGWAKVEFTIYFGDSLFEEDMEPPSERQIMIMHGEIAPDDYERPYGSCWYIRLYK